MLGIRRRALSLLVAGFAVSVCTTAVGQTLAAYAKVHPGADVKTAGLTYWISEGNAGERFPLAPAVRLVEFDDIAQQLTKALRKRGYEPSPDQDDADWLITVYRGRTEGGYFNHRQPDPLNPDSTELISVSQSSIHNTRYTPDPTDSQTPSPSARTYQIPISRRAATLGYRELFNIRPSQMRDSAVQEKVNRMFDELTRDRYYVLIAAYDWQSMQHNDRRLLLWETRLSTAAETHSFAAAAALGVTSAFTHC